MESYKLLTYSFLNKKRYANNFFTYLYNAP